MSQTPDEIRAEIEATRAELASDVDDLNQKVNPARVVERKVEGAKEAVGSVKDKVMGTVHGTSDSAGGTASSAASGVSGAAGSVAGAVTQSPALAKQKAAGNPLLAGALAFGVGYLLSTLLPATSKEQQAAKAIKEQATALKEPVKEQLTAVAAEVKDNLAPAAQEAASTVKESATSAAQSVQETAADASTTVTEQAKSSGAKVNQHAADSAGTVKQTAQEGGSDTGSTSMGDVAPYPAGAPATSRETTGRTAGLPPL